MHALLIVSWVFLGLGILSAVIIYIDINMGRYQAMPIMNVAWPITALYSSFLALYMYFKYGRAEKQMMMHHTKNKKTKAKAKKPHPKWVQIYISSTHCGAGCGLSDIVSETFIYWAGITIFGAVIWASFFIDYAVALLFGLAFQFFNIMPMRPELSMSRGIWESFKADILSLTSFQLGMYAWLLAVHFIFSGALNAGSPIYWFMMQIGLTIGLLTTYPVNALLIKWGVKVPCGS